MELTFPTTTTFYIFKKIDKFSIAVKSQLSETLSRKMFKKKTRTEIEK